MKMHQQFAKVDREKPEFLLAVRADPCHEDGVIEQFQALQFDPCLAHGFFCVQPGVDVQVERAEAVARLMPGHLEAVRHLGFTEDSLRFAEQVHGDGMAVVDWESPTMSLGVDGLITADPRVALGIYVADCAAVYLADTSGRCWGLVHSGKRGSELGIVPKAIGLMGVQFGVDPSEVIVQISPCIRPPHYEVDFASDIVQQCIDAGVRPFGVFDSGTCTASYPERYYSYRREKGLTGRMLALLGRNCPTA